MKYTCILNGIMLEYRLTIAVGCFFMLNYFIGIYLVLILVYRDEIMIDTINFLAYIRNKNKM